jgi:flagellar protein FliS
MNPYFEQMILSASPVELIRLLYQRAISSIRDAREHIRHGRIAERCASINVAYAVVRELAGSLRDDDAPELSANLKALYAYIQGRLVDANMMQQEEPLTEVLGLLTTLAEAWNAVPDAYSPGTASFNPYDSAIASTGLDSGVRFAASA